MWQPEQPPSQAVATRARTASAVMVHCGRACRGAHASAFRSSHSPSSRASARNAITSGIVRISPDARALERQRPGRAHQHALAAPGAVRHLAPGLVHPGDDPRLAATHRDVPDVGALDLVADPHAPGAQHAPVAVEARTSGARRRRPGAGGEVVVDVVDPVLGRQVLQLAGAAGDAEGADVAALGEQQLDDPAPVLAQPGEVVRTSISAVTSVAQAGLTAGGRPSTSTTHSRQPPWIDRPSR
jgi:hypothetical protein